LTAKTSKAIINHADICLYDFGSNHCVCDHGLQGLGRMNQDYSFAIGVVVVAIVFLLIL
jgi:hypothetical protein